MNSRMQKRMLCSAACSVFLIVSLLVGVEAVSAGQVGPFENACMQPVFTGAGGGKLNCTANDVVIAVATPTEVDGVPCGGTNQPVCSCSEGDTDVTVKLNITYQLSGGGSNQTRYDLGSYFDVGGGNSNGARTGSCIHTTIQSSEGDGFVNLDGDACGDINTAHNPLIVENIVLTGVHCTKATGTNKVQLPYCLSWRQPGANTVCHDPSGGGTVPVVTDAYPGTSSKCKCDDNFFIDVNVVPPATSGHKCAVESLGGCVTVRYEVQLGGSVATGGSDTSVSLESVVDNKFGSITTVHAVNTSCASGSSTCEEVTGTTCGVATANDGLGTASDLKGGGTLPANLGTSGSYTCYFDGKICQAPGTHTNQVTGVIKGHPSNQQSTVNKSAEITVNDISGSGLCSNLE